MKAKKSQMHDELDSSFLKSISDEICLPVSSLVNKSLESGIVPEKITIAQIIPFHKKGRPNSFNKNRPISILPVFFKNFENKYPQAPIQIL